MPTVILSGPTYDLPDINIYPQPLFLQLSGFEYISQITVPKLQLLAASLYIAI